MISKGRYVTELVDGERVRAVFMLTDRRLLTARTGKPYAKVVLTDRSGEIPGMIWEDAQQLTANLAPGDIIGIRGITESFNNALQIRIEKVVKLTEEDVDLATLLPSSRGDITEMFAELEDIIAGINDVHLSQLIRSLLGREDIREAFLHAPAAKGVHHNYLGGLLEHTLQMLKAIIALYPMYAHLGMNKDLILAGAVLHDLGKIYEYSYGKLIEMTPEGRLIGHIYLSARMADEEIGRIDGFPEELKLQLLHIILSHHGQLEFGSPKLPMTKEALFLHMVDDFDAKRNGFSSIIEATPHDQEFTAFSRIYERTLYTRRYESGLTEED